MALDVGGTAFTAASSGCENVPLAPFNSAMVVVIGVIARHDGRKDSIGRTSKCGTIGNLSVVNHRAYIPLPSLPLVPRD